MPLLGKPFLLYFLYLQPSLIGFFFFCEITHGLTYRNVLKQKKIVINLAKDNKKDPKTYFYKKVAKLL